jgi:hypothetical protein
MARTSALPSTRHCHSLHARHCRSRGVRFEASSGEEGLETALARQGFGALFAHRLVSREGCTA